MDGQQTTEPEFRSNAHGVQINLKIAVGDGNYTMNSRFPIRFVE